MTAYCEECGGQQVLSEWQYDPKAFGGEGGWRHTGGGCNWLARVPKKV